MNNSKKDKGQTAYFDIEESVSFVFSFSDLPTPAAPSPPVKMVGKIMEKLENNVWKIACCADRSLKSVFERNSIISTSYVELNSLFTFSAKVISIREAEDSDNIKVADFDNVTTSFLTARFMLMEIVPMSEPSKKQRREYFRVPLDITIYYKILYGIASAEKVNIRLDIERSGELKRMADRGILEDDMGYKKLKTLDVSAGGFKAKVRTAFKEEQFIDCMVAVDTEVLPAVAQVIECKQNYDNPMLYDLRCGFYKIGEPVRDRLVKYIFKQQRTIQNRFRRRF